MLRGNINPFKVHTTGNRGDKNVLAIVQRECYSRRWIKSEAAGKSVHKIAKDG